jgi:hypothetical protein
MEDESVVLWRAACVCSRKDWSSTWTSSPQEARKCGEQWVTREASRYEGTHPRYGLESRRFIPAPEPQEPADD